MQAGHSLGVSDRVTTQELAAGGGQQRLNLVELLLEGAGAELRPCLKLGWFRLRGEGQGDESAPDLKVWRRAIRKAVSGWENVKPWLKRGQGTYPVEQQQAALPLGRRWHDSVYPWFNLASRLLSQSWNTAHCRLCTSPRSAGPPRKTERKVSTQRLCSGDRHDT